MSLTRGQVYRQGLFDLDKGKVTQSFIDGGLYRVVTLYARRIRPTGPYTRSASIAAFVAPILFGTIFCT